MSLATSDTDPLYSNLSGDPDLRELVVFFVAALPDRLAAIDMEMAGGHLTEVRRLAHRLKRAASSHGFDGIVSPAERLKISAQHRASCDEVRRARDELCAACRRATADVPETATAPPERAPAGRARASNPVH